MATDIENWKTQIRKGYLELCVLAVLEQRGETYGFELLTLLAEVGLPVKEGTVYPLLNRMTVDGVLSSKWETEQAKGHPRKFYSLTREGKGLLRDMTDEFERMQTSLELIRSGKKEK